MIADKKIDVDPKLPSIDKVHHHHDDDHDDTFAHVTTKESPEGKYTENLRNTIKEIYYQNSDETKRRDSIETAKPFVTAEKIEKNLLP